MSCLFNSLSSYIENSNALELRHTICNFLEKDPTLIGNTKFSKLLGNEKISTYISNMRKQSTWGSAYEIRAFCEIYKVIVLVKTRDNRFIEFIPSNLDADIPSRIKLDWNGYHYEALKAL